MAFVDVDEFGEKFANVTHAVGPGKANRRDDVTLVQALLLAHFTYSTGPQGSTSANLSSIILGTFDDNTGKMIKDYQSKSLKRPKPQGFVDTARGKKKGGSTIWALNARMEMLFAANLDPTHALEFLRTYPDLAPSLR